MNFQKDVYASANKDSNVNVPNLLAHPRKLGV